MKITMSFNELVTALKAVTPVVEDKTIIEEQRTIILAYTDKVLSVTACTLFVTAKVDVQATVTFDENEDSSNPAYVRIKAKELNNVLKGYTNLNITKVDSIDFISTPNELRVVVHEVAKDVAFDEDATVKIDLNAYNRTFSHRLTKVNITEKMKTELTTSIAGIQSISEYATVERPVFQRYLNTCLSALPEEIRDTIHTRVTFTDKYVYVVPQTYTVVMKNTIPEALSGFILTNNVAKFMQSYCTIEETTQVAKQAIPNSNYIQLILKSGDSIAVCKAYDTTKAFDITSYTNIPANGMVFYRPYFLDIMKRIKDDSEDINIKLDLDSGSCKIVNKGYNGEVPVVKSKGSGTYEFTIKPKLFSDITFANTTGNLDCFGELLFMYLDVDDNNKVSITCADDKQVWTTKCRGLTFKNTDFKW